MNERCIDPCPNACGFNSVCNVINHIPQCSCVRGYEGDAFVRCQPIVIARKKCLFAPNLKLNFLFTRNMISPLENEPEVVKDTCYPSPCGPNTHCSNGICACVSDYNGDPYVGCQPECILNTQCARNQACIQNKCVNPCAINPCAREAVCDVINHLAICSCPFGLTGNPHIACVKVESMKKIPAISYNRSQTNSLYPLNNFFSF